MAIIPRGVAAFPRPKRFAATFIEIAPRAFSSFFKLGKTSRSAGLRNFRNFSTRPLSSATFEIPLQKQSEPRSLSESSAACEDSSRAAAETSAVFPVIMLKITEIKTEKKKNFPKFSPPFLRRTAFSERRIILTIKGNYCIFKVQNVNNGRHAK